jgi:hypothetical protein
MPRLTEYLLKLSTDVTELEHYRSIREGPKGAKNLDDYLTRKPMPGLTADQAEAISSHDSRRILRAVIDELARESTRPNNPFYGIAVTILCEVNNHIETRFSTDE